MPAAAFDRFIRANTTLAAAPAVPEVALHLATEVMPLWEATEAALRRADLPPPYWAFAWAGGQALARHVLDRPETVRGRAVMDFAAGCGIVALAAMKAGAARAAAVEIDPMAEAAIRLNAAANRMAVETVCADVVGGANPGWEVVLAGDICYERPTAARVFAWLRRLAGEGALVLLADPGRAYLPDRHLVEQARYLIPTSRDLEDRDARETVVYRVKG